jgi:hypothetical protein
MRPKFLMLSRIMNPRLAMLLGILLAVVAANSATTRPVRPDIPSVSVQRSAKGGAVFLTLSPVVIKDGKECRISSMCVVRHSAPYFSFANVEMLPLDSAFKLGGGAEGVSCFARPGDGRTWGDVLVEEDIQLEGVEGVISDAPPRLVERK